MMQVPSAFGPRRPVPAALALALALLAVSLPVAAGEGLACPALSAATQVDACPTDEQLQTGFTGYCSDNHRIYGADLDTCTRFENYRRLKNVALWEAGADGAFQGYLSCELPPERLRAAPLRAVTVTRKGSVTRVACHYGEGLTMALRTKAQCAVEADDACKRDASQCRVRCD